MDVETGATLVVTIRTDRGDRRSYLTTAERGQRALARNAGPVLNQRRGPSLARRRAASTAGPTSTMPTTVVMARTVSHVRVDVTSE